VTRSYDSEMPVIYCRDFGQSEALGDSNHGSVNDAQRKIKIGVHQLGHAGDVVVFQFSNAEAIAAERFKEGHFRPWSHSGLEEVADLAHHWRGHQERPLSLAQQP
jgi:hypothetical protein